MVSYRRQLKIKLLNLCFEIKFLYEDKDNMISIFGKGLQRKKNFDKIANKFILKSRICCSYVPGMSLCSIDIWLKYIYLL